MLLAAMYGSKELEAQGDLLPRNFEWNMHEYNTTCLVRSLKIFWVEWSGSHVLYILLLRWQFLVLYGYTWDHNLMYMNLHWDIYICRHL